MCCGVFALLLGAAGADVPVAPVQIFPRYPSPRDLFPIVSPYLPKNAAILEGGAYNGVHTQMLAELWPEGSVYSFEPVPELSNRVRAATAEYKNVHVFELALSDKVGEAKFYVSEFADKPDFPSESSSLLPPTGHEKIFPNIKFKKEITVKTTTMDSWAQQNGVDRIDFLYLDIQGAELMTVKGSPRLMKTVKVIMTEVESVELYTGQGLYGQLKAWLEQHGFQLIAANFDPTKGDPGFGDAIFVRN